jgi:hypothetical protein
MAYNLLYYNILIKVAMKYLSALFALVILYSATSKSQDYTFRYNPYSGMNRDQLELALEQATKMERNGKILTAIGAGMFVGGTVMTFRGVSNLSYEENFNFSSFGTGLVILCFSAIPLGYGMVAWITGHERANMIEIELLAFNTGKLHLKPTEDGIGLVLKF